MTEKSLENQYLEPWLLHNTDPLVTQITCVTRMCNVAFKLPAFTNCCSFRHQNKSFSLVYFRLRYWVDKVIIFLEENGKWI